MSGMGDRVSKPTAKEVTTVTISGNNPWHAIKTAATCLRSCEVEPAHTVGEHKYKITVERVCPKWWEWNGSEQAWEETFECGPYLSLTSLGDPICIVYATVEDRDAKRDELLEAGRKAGVKC